MNHKILPKREGLSSALRGQGQTYNPKCNPKRLPNETLGLIGMVAPTAPTTPTTPQNVVIGQFQTKNKSYWSRHFHNICPFPPRF